MFATRRLPFKQTIVIRPLFAAAAGFRRLSRANDSFAETGRPNSADTLRFIPEVAGLK